LKLNYSLGCRRIIYVALTSSICSFSIIRTGFSITEGFWSDSYEKELSEVGVAGLDGFLI
jgi:hypothetical protein